MINRIGVMMKHLSLPIILILAFAIQNFAQDHENVEQEGKIYSYWDVARDVTVEGDLAYVATGRTGLCILDVSDPVNPREIGTCDTPGWAYDVAVSGSLAFVADRHEGLMVVDVTVPQSPCEVGSCNTPGRAYGVAVSGGLAFVADFDGGLRVIDVSNPENPREEGYYLTPGDARGVAVSDELIFVADDTNLGIYHFNDPAKVDDPAVSIPVKFNLSAAYPNPFNSMLRVDYDLPEAAEIMLSVYDLYGRSVAELVSGRAQAGFHTASFNGSGLASGVYMLRYAAAGHASQMKVVLVK